jgi:hypothetical protein
MRSENVVEPVSVVSAMVTLTSVPTSLSTCRILLPENCKVCCRS